MADETIGHLLDQIYYSSKSEHEKGSRFERLVKRFLEVDPIYAQRFDRVIPWSEWSERTGQDVGIDLVAYERDGGGVCAIQCKFYDPQRTISKKDIDSFLSASGKYPFTSRLVVSTTTRWGANAEGAILNQQIPVSRIGLADLLNSAVDWSKFDITTPEVMELKGRNQLRPYQRDALADVVGGFEENDRGKLIMACGTGKTFTSLKIAEHEVRPGGHVLFLVPSLALLSQALWSWTQETEVPMRTFAVCSDSQVNKKRGADEDISAVDLAIPATTKPDDLARELSRSAPDDVTVVFATYQSLDVVHQAQELGAPDFDLVICDEAHRTTGATAPGKTESHFVRIHDNDYIHAAKRLYMTATPRIYTPAAKAKTTTDNITLASMDDPALYGPEFHRLGFGEAVRQKLLTDYKVVVLAVSEDQVSRVFQGAFERDGQLNLPDVAKIVGVWNALAKRSVTPEEFAADPEPMRRVVAFANSIKASKQFTETFTDVIGDYLEALGENGQTDVGELLAVGTDHIDGSMNMLAREERMSWLRGSDGDNQARILSNARCLSEGVDVPTLDGVAFLSPRKSQVDIVQSVGRVMRLAPGKEYGYIILPVAVPAGMSADEALDQSDAYRVVWEVLQALRSHDERFDAMINQIELNEKKPENIIFTEGDMPGEEDGEAVVVDNEGQQLRFDLEALDGWREAIYAKVVEKVGNTRYWETWAKDVSQMAARHRTRLADLIEAPGARDEFERFHKALQANLNEGISEDDAIDMLSQHLITKPVFEALFEGADFAANNPVAQVMETMLKALEPGNLEAETEELSGFYASVRERAAGIDNAAGKQKVAIELYENFFKLAFERTAKSLGIVYTPIEIVDFILRSTDTLLKKHFDVSISDAGVHVLDPFTGTGTFIVRLIQSGLISPHDLARKYAHELHANEILLLAYYIAAVNIEVAYQEQMKEAGTPVPYEPFTGIVLTDTFQITEEDDAIDADFFKMNNARVEEQLKLDIRVIVGNPPYSVGQTSANDNAANQKYPTLDARIEETYAARSTATNKNSLYDSYIRALRWSSDRIKDRGIIGYVTNGGFLDSNTADGLRKTLQDEFAHIYIYNLRGNQRTAGETSRKEGGKIFGSGSRNTIAVTLLVKDPQHSGPATLHYHDIGDYLTREQKLELIDAATVETLPWKQIEPNSHGDWINQRSETFPTWQPIIEKDRGLFADLSRGVETGRDVWVYNFNAETLKNQHRIFASTYADELSKLEDYRASNSAQQLTDKKLQGLLTRDNKKIKWTRDLRSTIAKGEELAREANPIREALYRPFTREFLNATPNMIYLPGIIRRYFPTPTTENYGFFVVAPGESANSSVLATDKLPDLHLIATGQFFPRFTYEQVDDSMLDVGTGDVVDGYRKRDNVTDSTLADYRATYGRDVSKDDIFAYVYGLLHSPDYRERFAADLKRMLPHIPKVSSAQDFWAFTDAGKELLDLHIGYEDVDPYPLEIEEQLDPDVDPFEFYAVTKLAYGKQGKETDKSTIVYNPRVTVRGIPEVAQDYMLGARSGLDWILDRYRVTVDTASGIVNDPNDWAREVGNPRYILDLIGKVTTVSMETLRIVDSLPPLNVSKEESGLR